MPVTTTLNSRLPEIIALLDVATDARVKELAEAVAEKAKEKLEAAGGVESGDLRDAIQVIPIDDNTYSVQAGDDDEVFYGHLVEYGTQASPKRAFSTAPKPFLIPAFEEVAESVGQVQFDL